MEGGGGREGQNMVSQGRFRVRRLAGLIGCFCHSSLRLSFLRFNLSASVTCGTAKPGTSSILFFSDVNKHSCTLQNIGRVLCLGMEKRDVHRKTRNNNEDEIGNWDRSHDLFKEDMVS